MRLGLLSDIHEAVEELAAAVRELKRRVDAFVMLGDVLDAGERVDETVALLAALPGVGVWGNHDLGLCGDVHPSVRARYSQRTLDYFAGLLPSVELGGSRFQHIDPHLDPESLEDLWRCPTSEERVAGFARCSHARLFMGHLHRWELVTPVRQVPWDGRGPVDYHAGERYLTVVNSVLGGRCALMDTDRDHFEPIMLA